MHRHLNWETVNKSFKTMPYKHYLSIPIDQIWMGETEQEVKKTHLSAVDELVGLWDLISSVSWALLHKNAEITSYV